MLLGWIAIVHSVGLNQVESKKPSSNEPNNKPSSEDVKPSVKQCKPVETPSSKPNDLTIGTITPKDASTERPSSTEINIPFKGTSTLGPILKKLVPLPTLEPKVTSSTTKVNLKDGDKNLDDCDPIPEGVGSRLDAQTLRTLVTKHLPQRT